MPGLFYDYMGKIGESLARARHIRTTASHNRPV